MKAVTERIFILSLAALPLLYSCGTTSQTAESNGPEKLSATEILSLQKTDATFWVNTSAEYRYLTKSIYKNASSRLFDRLQKKSTQKPAAVIMDLDETVLDNSRYMMGLLENRQTFQEESWADWCNEGNAPAVPGSLEYISFCHDHDIKVYYVSNRSVNYLDGTLRNLQKLGINTQIENLLLKDDESDKTSRRRMVLMENEVLQYVGDNLRDYNELYASRDDNYGKNIVDDEFRTMFKDFVILPNPMYGEWEKSIYKGKMTDEEKLKQKEKQTQPIDR